MKYDSIVQVYTVNRVIREMDELNGIRLDYPLQRAAGQWNGEQKSNLIRKILEQGDVPQATLASQINPLTNIETKWLIDGKQRLTTIREFSEDKFSLGKKTRYSEITYQTYKYETITKRGKIVQKLDKKGNPIYILDEDGNKIPTEMTIDIRGLKYSTLPKELQQRFDDFQISFKIIINATDELIQKEIRDMNSGSQMNSEQIGINCLGLDWANAVQKLAKHPFVTDYCGFTAQDKVKAKDLRSIYEALMIVNFPDSWKSNCEEMSTFLAKNLTQEMVDELGYHFDYLAKIFTENSRLQTIETRNFLRNKEFFVLLENFHKFMDMGYTMDCYGKFLVDWINELQFKKSDPDAEEDDSYAAVSAVSTKNKTIIKCRLELMMNCMQEYINTTCSDSYYGDEFSDMDFDNEVEEENEVSEISEKDEVDEVEAVTDDELNELDNFILSSEWDEVSNESNNDEEVDELLLELFDQSDPVAKTTQEAVNSASKRENNIIEGIENILGETG